MTYEELLKLIDEDDLIACRACTEVFNTTGCDGHGCKDYLKEIVRISYEAAKNECSDCLLPDKELSDNQYQEAYDKGYEAAAKDPNAWYVLDKNNRPAHIGDKVIQNDETHTIFGLGNDEVFDHWWSCSPATSVEKITPDSKEKIILYQLGFLLDRSSDDLREEELQSWLEEMYNRIAAHVKAELNQSNSTGLGDA